MNNIHILVFGANGQLGHELQVLASEYDYLFSFVTHNDADIREQKDIRQITHGKRITHIINCAAYTAVDNAEQNEDLAYQINADGAKNIAILANELHSSLIHISTDFVFSGNQNYPYHEDDSVNPLNVYGKSKLQGEREIQKSLPDATIIRTSWLYSSRNSNFVKTILRLAREKESINVVYDQLSSPTFTGDIARSILDIIPNVKSRGGGIFHYANEGVASWYDLAMTAVKFAGLELKINAIETRDYPTPANRPKYSVLAKDKIKKSFDIEIPYWQESLKKCITRLQEI